MTARLTLHVQPRARHTEVAGRHGDAIKLRVVSPPADGAANDELQRFIARRLGVPRAAVSLVGGLAARRKTVDVEGITTADAIRILLERAP